ncbi:hypothetical protein ACFE04_031832 [Oxalis oulophora]
METQEEVVSVELPAPPTWKKMSFRQCESYVSALTEGTEKENAEEKGTEPTVEVEGQAENGVQTEEVGKEEEKGNPSPEQFEVAKEAKQAEPTIVDKPVEESAAEKVPEINQNGKDIISDTAVKVPELSESKKDDTPSEKVADTNEAVSMEATDSAVNKNLTENGNVDQKGQSQTDAPQHPAPSASGRIQGSVYLSVARTILFYKWTDLSFNCHLSSSAILTTRLMGFSSHVLWLLLIFSVMYSHVQLPKVNTYPAVFTVEAFIGTYGVNYGRLADNLPQPESVVTLLKANRIRNIRLYDADHDVLKAFSGSGIEIIVGLGNESLKDISVAEDRAMTWIKENVQAFLPDTRIVGIAVGNEILAGTSPDIWEALLPAAKNVYAALNRLNLTRTIEVSSPNSEAVFQNSYPPSSCEFKEDVLVYMKPLLQFFSQIGSAFYINAYPFLAYKSDPEHIKLNYAIFLPNEGITDPKTNLHYDNMFFAQIDAAYFALEKAGFSKMRVIVSETGWSSKGDSDEAGANEENARTYNKNMRKILLKKKGTPYKPKSPIRAYIFALFNEDRKSGPTSERNFGLFKPDGSTAYKIGFTGLVPSSASAPSALSLKVFGAQSFYSLVLTACLSTEFITQLVVAQTVHVVGDDLGWTLPPGGANVYTNWAARKQFEVGDILTFNFDTDNHDVQQVKQPSFESCITLDTIGDDITTGPSNITLITTGPHYYICTVGSHCLAGQKVLINVRSPMSGDATSPSTAPIPTTSSTASSPV